MSVNKEQNNILQKTTFLHYRSFFLSNLNLQNTILCDPD
jgi:hypothetical protein